MHIQATKKVLRYIKRTFKFRILYRKARDEELVAYIDNDYVGDLVNKRYFRLGYVFLLSSVLFLGLLRNSQ